MTTHRWLPTPRVRRPNGRRWDKESTTILCPRCGKVYDVADFRAELGLGYEPVPVTFSDGTPARTVGQMQRLRREYRTLRCPAGEHHKLPDSFLGNIETFVVPLIGLKTAGKSQFLWAAVTAAIAGSDPLAGLGVRFTMSREAQQTFYKTYVQMVNHEKLPETHTGDIQDIFALTVCDTHDQPLANLLLLDVPGESLDDPARMELVAPYLELGDGILIFAGDETVQETSGSKESKYQGTTTMIRNVAADLRSSRRKAPLATCLVLGKSDRLKRDTRFPRELHLPADYREPTAALRRIGIESELLRGYLNVIGASSLAPACDALSRGHLAVQAVAATGCDPDATGHYQAFNPDRCLDPLVVMLAWFRLIDESRLDAPKPTVRRNQDHR